MDYITRTFTGFNVEFTTLDAEGKPAKETIYVPGTAATKEAAIKRAVKGMAGKGIMTGVSYVEELRGMEVGEFYKLSKPVTRPPSQQKKPANDGKEVKEEG